RRHRCLYLAWRKHLMKLTALALTCTVAMATSLAAAQENDPTILEIQSRWDQNRFLIADGDKVQTARPTDDNGRWTLEPSGSAYLLRSRATGKYVRVSEHSDALTLAADAPAADRGRWFVSAVDIYATLQNVATGKYINIE